MVSQQCRVTDGSHKTSQTAQLPQRCFAAISASPRTCPRTHQQSLLCLVPQPLAATSLLPALFTLLNAVALVTCCVMLSSGKTGPASSGDGVRQHGGRAFFKRTLCLVLLLSPEEVNPGPLC